MTWQDVRVEGGFCKLGHDSDPYQIACKSFVKEGGNIMVDKQRSPEWHLLRRLYAYNPIPLEAFYRQVEEDDEALLRIYIPLAISEEKLWPKVEELAKTIAEGLGLTIESTRLGIKSYLHPERGLDECLVIWEISSHDAIDGIGGYYIAYYYEPEEK